MFVLIAVALVAVLYTRLSGGDEPAPGGSVAAGTASQQGSSDTRSDRQAEDVSAQEAPSPVRVGSARDQQVATVPDDGFEGLLGGSRSSDAQRAGAATDAQDSVSAGAVTDAGSPVTAQGGEPTDRDEEDEEDELVGEDRGTGAAAVATALPNSLTLAGGVVTLAYPAALALATSGQPLQVAATIPPCDAGFDYCFHLSEGSFAGTNFRAAGMSVTLRKDLTAQLSCLLAQPSGFQDLQPGLAVPALEGPTQDKSGSTGTDSATEARVAATIGPSTSRFGGLGEGAAGTYYNGEERRLFIDGACYEFTTRVVESQFGNYPEGAVVEFTAEQRAAVLSQFDEVLASATVTVGGEIEPVEWPREGGSDLAPFIRLEEPAAGEAVTSPLRLVGEAVGPWYFEGSFPVSVVAGDGSVLGQGFVSAQGEWMVDGLVPFVGEVEFEAPQAPDGSPDGSPDGQADGQADGSAAPDATATGLADPGTPVTVVLARDNPSGLPEHDAALHVKVLVAVEAGE